MAGWEDRKMGFSCACRQSSETIFRRSIMHLLLCSLPPSQLGKLNTHPSPATAALLRGSPFRAGFTTIRVHTCSIPWERRSANLFCQKSDNKYFRLCSLTFSVTTTQIWHCCVKSAIDSATQTSRAGFQEAFMMDAEMWISCTFHMSWNTLLLLIAFNHLKM